MAEQAWLPGPEKHDSEAAFYPLFSAGLNQVLKEHPQAELFLEMSPAAWAEWEKLQEARDEAAIPTEEESYLSLGYQPFDLDLELYLLRQRRKVIDPLINLHGRAGQEHLARLEASQVWQEEGLAVVTEQLWRKLVRQPDVSEQELFSFVLKAGEQYLFNQKQLRKFKKVITKLKEQQQLVNDICEGLENEEGVGQFSSYVGPEVDQLFAYCFGYRPVGEIGLKKGVISLDFLCYDFTDYLHAFTLGSYPRDPTQLEIKQARASGAVALNGSLDPQWKGALVAQNMSHNREPDFKYVESLHEHEEQHQLNKLFQTYRPNYLEKYRLYIEADQSQRAPEKIAKQLVKGLLEIKRRDSGIDDRARDEIIAYYKDNNHSLAEIRDLLCTNMLLYDFKSVEPIKGRVESLPEFVKTQLRFAMQLAVYEPKSADCQEEDQLVLRQPLQIQEDALNELVNEVLTADYFQSVSKWVEAISVLEQKGYSREEIVSRLYLSPVHRWAALVKRVPVKSKPQVIYAEENGSAAHRKAA